VRITTSAALEVQTDSAAARFFLAGSGSAAGVRYAGGGQWWRVEDAAPGTYAVELDAVAGHVAVACSRPRSVVAGETATFRIAYRPDANGDQLDDAWTARYFGLAATVKPGDDADGDGADNGSEYLAGTSPIDPDSVLAVRTIGIGPDGEPQITWDTAAGCEYRIEWSARFEESPVWSDLGGDPLEGNGRYQHATDAEPVSDRRFYRLRAWRLP
jgi:hypothetical protein